MNNIIQQICSKYISEISDFLGGNEIRSIDDIENTLKEITNEYLQNMIKVYLEKLDEAIFADRKGRKKKGYTVERKGDARRIYTQFGSVEFARRYYKDKHTEQYRYLLDDAVGLEGYSRISNSVVASLVESASEMSYQKSSKYICDGDISRQTVMNKVRQLKELKIEPAKDRREVKVLHVEADEDHVALQDGTNTIVPLISIHEGVTKTGKRGSCKNIHYISSHGKDMEELWQEAAEWVYSTYKEDSIEKIYLHGDGATWIRKGLEYLPKSSFVLDRYHMNKSLKEAGCNDEILQAKLRNAVIEANKEYFNEVCREIRMKADSERAIEKLNKVKGYILSNWDGIEIYKDERSRGSNTEGHISHVLSSRLSSRPMGWSRLGLKAMSELRAYCCNGGSIQAKHINREKVSYKLGSQALSKVAKEFRKVSREIQDNIPVLNIGKVTPLYKLLKGYRNINI